MVTPEDIAAYEPYNGLPPPLLDRIASRAADISANKGEVVLYAGESSSFWTVLEGEVEVLQRYGNELVQLTTFEPGESFGEMQLVMGTDATADVRALTPTRLMRVDPIDFHVMLSQSPAAQEFVTRTVVRRMSTRSELFTQRQMSEAAVVGGRFDFSCHDIRDFLSRNQIAFEWLDPEIPGDVEELAPSDLDPASHPLVILPNGRRLVNPSTRELAVALNLQTEPTNDTYDVAIIGGGPAGLAAAVYGGSEGLRTIMIEREAPGGQAGTSSRIENYLGFPSGISGGQLASRALLQAKRFGSEILVTRSVQAIATLDDGLHCIELDGGRRLPARALIVATGVTWRDLDAKNAQQFIGRGVYYGAARTEALGTRGKDIILVGGGNSAGQAAMFFSNYAKSVTIVVRGASLSASMSHYLIEQLATKRNIALETRTVVTEVAGNAHLDTVVTKNVDTGETTTRSAEGVFVFIGADAVTGWLPPEIERDARGYLRTGRDVANWPLERAPYPLETNVPGIFAVGDVRSDSVKRVAAGVGEGSMVVSFIHQYLAATPA
jgi:thioredoxin reductase (NADPH)